MALMLRLLFPALKRWRLTWKRSTPIQHQPRPLRRLIPLFNPLFGMF
jgi:hypothetical protein